MALCQNCRNDIGCSCNAKMASNGQSCCGACLYKYEQSLLNTQPKQETKPLDEAPPINQTYQVPPLTINSITHNYNT